MNKREKTIMITSDYHVPYADDRTVNKIIQYAKKHQPDVFILNGDILDCYSISKFDKNPDRKESLQDEINQLIPILKRIRTALPKAKIYYAKGNHEHRIEKTLLSNPGLYDLDALKLDKLLEFYRFDIELIDADSDYWSDLKGHLKIGNVVIAHGDNRLNGFKTSQYSGYSAKNTMTSMMINIVMSHVHRLAHVYMTTPYGEIEGFESGCACKIPGTANWQHGFVTLKIKDGRLIEGQTHKL